MYCTVLGLLYTVVHICIHCRGLLRTCRRAKEIIQEGVLIGTKSSILHLLNFTSCQINYSLVPRSQIQTPWLSIWSVVTLKVLCMIRESEKCSSKLSQNSVWIFHTGMCQDSEESNIMKGASKHSRRILKNKHITMRCFEIHCCTLCLHIHEYHTAFHCHICHACGSFSLGKT